MIVSRMAKHSRALLALLIVLVVPSLVLGMNIPSESDIAPRDAPAAEADSGPSVTCIPLGLYGNITAPVVVDRLSEGSDNLTFVGTSNGLYVVAPGGKLVHFLYSPFGIGHFALIDDITDDGIREVVVALNDTQVPALRCYDGATWDKLWQFAPMAKIWDRLWVERQLGITGLEVIEGGDSQSVVITSGRRVYSVNAEDGTECWQFSASSVLREMTTVADINGDDADEVFAGSNDGHLYLLNGKTGEARWRTKLPKRSVNGEVIESAANDILPLDRAAGRVAVVSRDGLARLFDLSNRTVEWAVSVSDDGVNGWRITLVPDITSDGLPEMLVTYASSYSQGIACEEGVVLFDSDGNKLWDKKLYVWHDFGVEVGSCGGKPVILEPKGQEIRLVDVKDGETVIKTIPIATIDGQAPMVKQLGETSFLLASSASDLSVISALGETLWNYPRITNVKAEGGNFVGDGIEDTLFWCEYGTQNYTGSSPIVEEKDGMTVVTNNPAYTPQIQEPTVRLLKMMDGATRAIAWSYQVPSSELKDIGGLKGIEATPDMVAGDNVQDIIGYREDTVFIFSGKDGALSRFSVGQPIESLEVIHNGASGNAIALGASDPSGSPGSGTSDALMIVDSAGSPLCTTTSAEWLEDESGSFMVLDDVNSDNVSDLAIISTTEIVLLKSVAGTVAYESHLTFKAEADYSISYAELVPDADKDGVKELACIQQAEAKQQAGQYVPPPNPLLSQKSLVDGKEIFRVQLPASWPAYDLACGDFNGDGYADSLFSYYSGGGGSELSLWVLSGKDGAILRTHLIKSNPYAGPPAGNSPPAINIGDVNNDGADDVVCSFDPHGKDYSSGYDGMQLGLEVYSVSQDKALKTIVTTPWLKEGIGGYYGGSTGTKLWTNVDADGYSEVIVEVFEPWIPSYNPDTNGNPYTSQSDRYLAVADMDGGRRLAAFMGFNPASISLFQTHRPGVLGVAAAGGAYLLDANAHLQVTSPEDGARTGPTVGVRWEGPTDGDFSQVFVDGVRNDITNGFGADLYLGRGDHDIVVRSVDDYGRISYSPSDLSTPLTIRVTPSPWKPVLLVLTLFFLLAMILLLFYARLHRMWRARRRATK